MRPLDSQQRPSWLRLVGWPVVGFLGRVATPSKERVVEQHPGAQLLEIVVVYARQAEGCREQAGRFRREIEMSGIGGAHHRGQALQGRRREPELLDHHVEGAQFAAVAPEYV